MLPAYEQCYLRFQFNKIYNFHTFPRQFLSINQSKNQTSHQSNLQYTSFELTSEEICRLLIDFPTTYRFERVDSTGWHFSLVFLTLPPPPPLFEKVSHGTTTRPSRDSWNIERRLAGPWSHKSWRARRNAFTQETAHAERVHASALQRWPLKRGERERERGRTLDKSADNTIRPIINLIVISIGIENRPRSASG